MKQTVSTLPVADFIDNVNFLLPFSDRILWHIIHITIMIPGFIAVLEDTAGKLVKFNWKYARSFALLLCHISIMMAGTICFSIIFIYLTIFYKITSKLCVYNNNENNNAALRLLTSHQFYFCTSPHFLITCYICRKNLENLNIEILSLDTIFSGALLKEPPTHSNTQHSTINK